MNGIENRLREFINFQDHHSLMVDVSAGIALGALPGLEDFSKGVTPTLPAIDGLVCSPGQLRRVERCSQTEAALLVRADWTNVLRGPGFVLPPAHPQRIALLSAKDASDLGACGMVISFLLGYEEEVEAACMRDTVQFALEGKALGLPLVVEVRPTGSRVSMYGKAVELGASYALEGGADVIVIPNPGKESLKTIASFVSVPWLVKTTGLAAAEELETVMALGGAGLWLDHAVFEQPDPAGQLKNLHSQIHPALERA